MHNLDQKHNLEMQKHHRESDILLNTFSHKIENVILDKKQELIRSGKLGQVIVEDYVRKEYDQDPNHRHSMGNSDFNQCNQHK